MIDIRLQFGWKKMENKATTVYYSGYTFSGSLVNSIENFLKLIRFDKIFFNEFNRFVSQLDGHFSIVIVDNCSNSLFAAVDRIASIPLYSINGNSHLLTNYLQKDFNDDINIQAKKEIAMSGYTIGNKTLMKSINRLTAGESIFCNKGKIFKNFYYSYIPSNSKSSYSDLKVKFKDVLVETFQKVIDSCSGRQIVVPLSAGRDSRLVVAMLKYLKYDNVLCFSYGRKGNYEVKTGRKIAEKLGYKWVNVPVTVKEKRAFFKSNIYQSYIESFESFCTMQNVQDIYEIYKLLSLNEIDKDAIFINGNTGDFISGGHIRFNDKLEKKSHINSFDYSPFLDKHYSLWSSLRGKKHDEMIVNELFSYALKRNIVNKFEPFYDFSFFESMEYLGRQSSYVIGQQRAYDFFGYEWRLPFWRPKYVNFWEQVPAKQKFKQNFYMKVLVDLNIESVWKEIPVNKKIIRPYYLLLVRLFAKIIFSPFGKERWHYFEKNILTYWIHPTYARSIESYKKIALDRRGQRNTLSWITDHFFIRMGMNGVQDIKSGKLQK